MVNLKKRKKGFTLIELIIVIAIIAILAAVTVPRLSGFRDSAKEKADIANAKVIVNTVSVLLANGDISDVSATSGDLNNERTDADVTKYTSVDKIEAALQDVPTPQVVGSNFIVAVSGDVVKVYVGYTSSTDNIEIYPTPDATNYAD